MGRKRKLDGTNPPNCAVEEGNPTKKKEEPKNPASKREEAKNPAKKKRTPTRKTYVRKSGIYLRSKASTSGEEMEKSKNVELPAANVPEEPAEKKPKKGEVSAVEVPAGGVSAMKQQKEGEVPAGGVPAMKQQKEGEVPAPAKKKNVRKPYKSIRETLKEKGVLARRTYDDNPQEIPAVLVGDPPAAETVVGGESADTVKEPKTMVEESTSVVPPSSPPVVPLVVPPPSSPVVAPPRSPVIPQPSPPKDSVEEEENKQEEENEEEKEEENKEEEEEEENESEKHEEEEEESKDEEAQASGDASEATQSEEQAADPLAASESEVRKTGRTREYLG